MATHDLPAMPGDEETTDAAVDERRRCLRRGCAVGGTVRPVGGAGADARPVTLSDLSLQGAGFRCPEPLRVGSRYRLRVGPGPLNLSARVRVASCRMRPDGAYDVGGEFC